MELLELWQIQSENVVAGPNVNSLFILYVIVCSLIKRPVFLLVFLLPELMFNLSFFDNLQEWHINAIELVTYSYIFEICRTNKSKFACVIITCTSIVFGIDSYLFGEYGIYGESETFIYNNLSTINASAHIFFISTLIPYSRIQKHLLDFINWIVCFSRNSACMLFY